MLAEVFSREFGLAAVAIGIEQATIFRREEFARGDEFLLGEQRREQTGNGAAALMEFHRRCAPCGVSAGGLAACETEGARHGLAVEAAQAADGGGRTEGSEHAG